MSGPVGATGAATEAIWHDVECGAYSADLPAWLELAGQVGGPVLELGAGTGRVSLALAEAGLEVVALDRSPGLLSALRRRAVERRLDIETVAGDARELNLGRSFAAILAPMQFVHLLGQGDGRAAMLRGARSHLAAGGVLAAALLADDLSGSAEASATPPLPDVRELGGWVYSSLPIEVAAVPGGFQIRRLRQVVSPAGELAETTDAVRLDELSADGLESEALEAGLRRRERLEVPPTADHVGSQICVLEVC
jgi:SAM-dependent methyltransferase